MSPTYIRWFSDIGSHDLASVGGKNASLGEMYQQLSGQNIKVPDGFAVTTAAYRELLEHAGIESALKKQLSNCETDTTAQLCKHARACRELILNADLPSSIEQQIVQAYRTLQYSTARAKPSTERQSKFAVAVRSSATAEDLPTASFAGQHDSFLNISGDRDLLDACLACFASLFTERAIRYRINNGIDHFDVALSIGIMQMVRADLGSSGVMFTVDTESGHEDIVFITAAFGLGESVVQGSVSPDEFLVHKPTLAKGFKKVLRRRKGDKLVKMVYSPSGEQPPIHEIATDNNERDNYALNDTDVLTLADSGVKIEQHYSKLAGHTQLMDIEWAKDGISGELFIIQARPETIHSQSAGRYLEKYQLGPKPANNEPAKPAANTPREILRGQAVGHKIATGSTRVIRSDQDLMQFEDGEILVAEMTSPDWGAVMSRAAALITDHGSRTCHAAIVARELGIPAVVGCETATQVLNTGDTLTVDCSSSSLGKVYSGALPYHVDKVDLDTFPRPKTHIMLNLANPDQAFMAARIPCDGVGLARLEFIITEHVKVHPMAVAHPEKIANSETKHRITELAQDYADPSEYFCAQLSEGVATIAAAFYPRPVIVRMSDFKTNEYSQLLGGSDFEPDEENPMLGFRGAFRYTHPNYADGFALECAALKRARDDMGMSNIKLMIPFCRRIDEAEKVIAALDAQGLRRGTNGLEIYIMCEIPNNVVCIDEFAEFFDGFSIGSNDLTQLTLGIDRDSDLLAEAFDERDPGVKRMCEQAIAGAHLKARHIGICGQAPSDYPDFAAWLISAGIDSISLNPDSVLSVTEHIVQLEQQ